MRLTYVAIGLVLANITAVITTATKAAAVSLYPNDLSNNQVVRLQMEKTAPNGSPVTLNITPQYGFRNGGLLNTWIGSDGDSLFRYLTNNYGINFQRLNSNYSIAVKDTNVTPGNTLNTYQSGFGRYQDWNLEKVGGPYGDTYLFHWRTDLDTNLCLDIRGFGQGQRLDNQIPVVWHCDRNNVNQRIRVIKQGQNLAPTPQQTTQVNFGANEYRNSNIFWNAGYAPVSTGPRFSYLGAALGNCTWYANGRGQQMGWSKAKIDRMSGNASQWGGQATAAGIRTSNTPQVGAIAQWDVSGSMPYGHVAVVEGVNRDGTVLISESSYGSGAWNFLYRQRTIAVNNPSRYILQ